ncbi:HEAT repeat domain-containing protein [Paenibacillus sp. CF384]|uniref:HEAT repeat domain-containing protein n=1 Tax=Paenibacillus sp. CF384 TaxID=1884382 RepID=UPI00089AA257|nr:HEAT repeat domain-containing protein [Paenibacillus sp. CF384]SDX05600.1 HEAT repeat-containing protein [Paenibacillus sp. CF384]
MNNYFKNLTSEINSFKNWEDKLTDKSKEWETEYLHWDRIYLAVNKVLRYVPLNEWEIVDDELLLYALARDNEVENVLQLLIEYPEALKRLAYRAFSYEDYEARWQVAFGLGEIENKCDEVQELLTKFLQDENEYVRRRATFAIEKG